MIDHIKNALAFRIEEKGGKTAKTQSRAIDPPMDTSLGRLLVETSPPDSADSGFLILDRGAESLKARLALILSAEHSIDLQYYAINNDVTSNLLVEAVIRAAERGVRVRFLIDDISVGRVYKNLLFLDSIDNIDIRIFNPISTGNQAIIARFAAFFRRFRKTRMRMHNKAIIADNLACMTGGRNLGDEYFDTNPDVSFKDIDALTIGGTVRTVSESFDAFWNADNAWPLAQLYGHLKGKRYARRVRKHLLDSWRKTEQSEDGGSLNNTLGDYLKNNNRTLIFAPARFVYDTPSKIGAGDAQKPEGPIRDIRSAAENAAREFLVVSPYFVPDGGDLGWMESLAARHVKVRVLTNSLASTDVVAVHTGYAPHRKRLIEKGIDLFELKPLGEKRTRQRIVGRGAPSYASLHAKVYVIDRKTCVIGSLNFDPRSFHLNTESALIIENESLSNTLQDLFDEAISPKNSYAIMLSKKGRIRYRTFRKGRIRDYVTEPDCSWWRKFQYALFAHLPVKDEL